VETLLLSSMCFSNMLNIQHMFHLFCNTWFVINYTHCDNQNFLFHCPSWPRSCFVSQAGLDLVITLPLSLSAWITGVYLLDSRSLDIIPESQSFIIYFEQNLPSPPSHSFFWPQFYTDSVGSPFHYPHVSKFTCFYSFYA
jgi:hypothetical protein